MVMFKRSNRAKMLALVAALGTVGANMNSNAGAASKAVPVIAGAAGGLLTGLFGMAALVKYTDFGKRIAHSNDVKKMVQAMEAANVNELVIIALKSDVGFKVVGEKLLDSMGEKFSTAFCEMAAGMTEDKMKGLKGENAKAVNDKMLKKCKEYAFYFANSFGEILNKIEMPDEVSIVSGQLLQISIKADGKGNLEYSFDAVKNVELENGKSEMEKIAEIKHSEQGEKVSDEKQKAIDKYIDDVKNALEEHPAIQAIKKSKNNVEPKK